MGGGGGGITIQSPDASPPGITLGASQGGQNVTVSNGGNPASLALTAKTGSMTLLATGTDQESGLKDVQIWATTQITDCSGATCTTQPGGGLQGAPRFSAPGSNRSPGDTTASSTILSDSLNLTSEIPQGSPTAGSTRTVTMKIWAVAINYVGGRSQTSQITATFSE
jgi:hypothetical protein